MPSLSRTSLPGRIWRLLPNAKASLLAVELRSTTVCEVRFVVLTLPELQWLSDPFPGPQPWWCGLEALGNQLYMHGYAAPDMPDHLGIFAYTLTGELQSQYPTWQALPPDIQPPGTPTLLPDAISPGSAAEQTLQGLLADAGMPQAIPPFFLLQVGGYSFVSYYSGAQQEVAVFRNGCSIAQVGYEEPYPPALEPFFLVRQTLVLTPAPGDIVTINLSEAT